MPSAAPLPTPAADADLARHAWRLDVGEALPGLEPLEVAATLVAPGRLPPRALLVCLPGGFLTGGYYDLEIPGEADTSFGAAMAARGFATLALDHLGTGESARPADGWQLDAEAVARANHVALGTAMARLGLDSSRTPRLPVLGVGHSMGSCLAVVQQAEHEDFDALVLFSFATSGLPAFLQGSELEVAGDPEAIRMRIADLARERFGAATPHDGLEGGHAAFQVGTAPASAAEALRRVSTGLLPIPGLLSMIPGGYAPWAERVRVPTLVALGDHDLPVTEADAVASLPNAPRVATFTQGDAWHCHFVANTRRELWRRVAEWIDDTLSRSA